MKKQCIGVAIVFVTFFGECARIDRIRAQLSSNNISEVRKAEETIYTIATTGEDFGGFVDYSTPQQVEYVKLTSNQDLLLKIIDNSRNVEVINAAIGCLDFSKKGAAYSFIIQRPRGFYRTNKDLKEQIVSKLTQEELLDMMGDLKARGERRPPSILNLAEDDRDMLRNRLIAMTDSPTILWRMLEGDIYIGNLRGAVERRLLSILDKVTDEQMIEKILSAHNQSGMLLVDKLEQRILLIKKLPESKIVTLVLKNIDDHSVYAWHKGNLSDLEIGIAIAAYIKDTKSVAKIVAAVFTKIAKYRKECKESWAMHWGKKDEEQAMKLIAGLPKLSDSVIAATVCLYEPVWKFLNVSSWKYLIDKVTEEHAYNILVQGKAKSAILEVALVKKLSAQKVDMKVFACVKTDAGKKAVMAAMPVEVKKVAQESTAEALVAVMSKAKEARKETFEMHGFYLGMDWEDMKLVLSHHFPEYVIKEARDGDGGDADYVVYLTNQSTPFCYASAKDKKIYQFNFGKQVLKKWYKYDVQTFMEWARAYSIENKIDMRYKMLKADTDVLEFDLSRSYKVWFQQESYQYKHNTKEYRLTFFGEDKIDTYHSGLGGSVIKGRAAEAFRYLRDNPGTLRAQIERD